MVFGLLNNKQQFRHEAGTKQQIFSLDMNQSHIYEVII